MQTSAILNHIDNWFSGIHARFLIFIASSITFLNPLLKRKANDKWQNEKYESTLQRYLIDVAGEHNYCLKYLSKTLYLNCFLPSAQAYAFINVYKWHIRQIIDKLPSLYTNFKIHLKKSSVLFIDFKLNYVFKIFYFLL